MIIDDGSTDNPYDTIKEWLKKDDGFEIKYIHKKMVECIQHIMLHMKILIQS